MGGLYDKLECAAAVRLWTVQSHPVVPDGQNQELTIRDSETSGRVK